ncbi:RagB/SusD family nutrient uptake outer membrane protein [Pedobacter caeni]|uniref:Susd and RagB outer membrane lipoprotein n=1 Tax=Pedobacter caeni TaxID=288992 RepID=A0A1M5B9U0_9SPHI|nr:RagB/SusD family nutrient uptake outer membrane protein [Pedobacter caeni]SHF39218.1 Susd and RagB outer membrane lipoprotein [Pedobacter caeni]
MNSNKFSTIKTGISLRCFPVFILLFLSACTKNFLEHNTDPGKATNEQLKYDNLGLGGFITQMQTEIFPVLNNKENADVNNYQLIYSLMGDIYSGHQGTSNAFNNNGVNNSTYAMVPDWYGAAFANAYTNVMSPWFDIKGRSELSSPSTYALAQIIKVMGMHRITDTYGPLPYLKFSKGSISTPYDAQEVIYNSFFEDLNVAIATLKDFVQKNPGAKPLAKFDLIYGGDFVQWLKFANSLKLRLAMRIANVNPAKAQLAAEEAISAGVMLGNDDNALLKVNGVSTVNPLFTITYAYNDTRMGANMESFLKGFKDPRIGLLFNKSALPAGSVEDYHGIRNGSRFSGRDYSSFSTLNVKLNTPVQWMTAAEVYFLRAEAALRNWSAGGTAQALYETGIKTAFSQNIGGDGKAAGDASTYINDGTSKPAAYADPKTPGNGVAANSPNLSTITIKWNAGSSFNVNLERIITQKWIALYPDGQEAWSEFRRTGFPKIFPVVNNLSNGLISSDKQIRRSPFPQNEYLNNSAAVSQGISLLGGPDHGGTPLWWDKRP